MYKAIIFDFYRTLSPSDYFAHLGEDVQKRINALAFSESQAVYWQWLRGEIDSTGIGEILGRHLGFTSGEMMKHFDNGCRRIKLSPVLMNFGRQHRLKGTPVGIVTLNFDVFTKIIVPQFALNEHFDFIINSADFGCSDKQAIFCRAFERLGLNDGTNCLLIDDDQRWIAAFQELGGTAKLYKGDSDFEEWRCSTA